MNVLAPGQGSLLLDVVLKNTSDSADNNMQEIPSEAHNISTDWEIQRQTLSLIA